MRTETSRLILVPSSPEQLLALIDNADRLTELAGGVALAPRLRDFFVSPDVSADWVTSLRRAHGPDPWHYGFFVVERSRNVAIGSAGYKGPPDSEGAVEIAYAIVPSHEGCGYATEAAQALIDYARDMGQASLVRAHTLPERNASTRVLEKCGFDRVGLVVDPNHGPVWRWERPSSSGTAT